MPTFLILIASTPRQDNLLVFLCPSYQVLKMWHQALPHLR